ncbi:FemAB family XrtA/PEP-CTERM system-associated protein [Steroidobacter sp.]|uniref:FemAB family XrtA/PEP-CTERM system-associated protein n=1 Tax=Steroidobacter sp. TaxID=1978227 RepID=UPI001A3B56B1|nr:FemAB family XrtA/PEP-CTERM system-associated protein [Steroidobacter sp.]MBL8270477.1 FemAB family PEP-CTERM system-associated protein [Steroidobacter sp.]
MTASVSAPPAFAPATPAPSAALTIEACSTAHGAQWNEYLTRRPEGSYYHLFEWQQINQQALGHRTAYLLARDGATVRGVLPLTFVSSPLFGRILCSLPFVNYGGPIADDEIAKDALVKAAQNTAKEWRADYLELRCADQLQTDMPVSTRKISMHIALDPDPDVLWNKFSSKHRTNIRRSQKNELVVTAGGSELLETFYSVMEQSWRQLGTPLYKRSYFESILRALPDHTRIFVCARGTEPVAVAFNGYFNGTVEGLWAGGTELSRPLQANYALYWEMIREACVRGCTRYHLGRSTADSGAEDFKKKWNATSSQLYWYFHRPNGGEMPQLNVDNPKYKLAIDLWRRLPLWTTRIIGPPLARLIP